MAKEQIGFSVDGNYITDLARTMFYEEDKQKGAIDILMSCTTSDELSEYEQLALCFQILDGKAELKGTYPNDDYGVVFKPEEKGLGVFKKITDIRNREQSLKEENDELLRKFNFFISYLQEQDYTRLLQTINREYKDEFGDYLFPQSYKTETKVSSMLDEYIKKAKADMQSEKKYNPDEDYGWLEPNGTYHPMGWGKHNEFACDYTEKNYPYKEYHEMYWKTNSDGTRTHYVGGDFLVYVLGWVLIDNPYQGNPKAHYDKAKGLTKAQREFLYNHFRERNMIEEANKLYEDDD